METSLNRSQVLKCRISSKLRGFMVQKSVLITTCPLQNVTNCETRTETHTLNGFRNKSAFKSSKILSPCQHATTTTSTSILAVFHKVELRRLARVTCVRETPDSKPGRGTDYPNRGFSWFSSVPPRKCRDDTSIKLLSVFST